MLYLDHEDIDGFEAVLGYLYATEYTVPSVAKLMPNLQAGVYARVQKFLLPEVKIYTYLILPLFHINAIALR